MPIYIRRENITTPAYNPRNVFLSFFLLLTLYLKLNDIDESMTTITPVIRKMHKTYLDMPCETYISLETLERYKNKKV